ncbi:hypothetical protein J2S17_004245 [Cytobacillus purgationiresistens]|uniref:Uncharacterized protein n=1 Tax=Cytobacillus purgationiresistens TaxID=863449 RepID=A0ABU0AM72_9BACI|nr:hypothetical protein [Cytobacillus purgationiresistens]
METQQEKFESDVRTYMVESTNKLENIEEKLSGIGYQFERSTS